MNTNYEYHMLNKRIAKSMLICVIVVIALLLLHIFGIFDFRNGLFQVIAVIGFATTLTPIILWKLNVPDTFLKYYMSIMMALFVGTVGCFNEIGIFLTFLLVPVASCLYIDTKYTIFCSVFSYFVMAASVFINSAGKMEVTYYGWTQLHTFVMYMIGFTMEFFVVTLFLAQVMKRARKMLDEQQKAHLLQEQQDARYRLVVKGTKDIIFEYYPREERYEANRSIYSTAAEPGDRVIIEGLKGKLDLYPGMRDFYSKIAEGFMENKLEDFEIDMSYDSNGTLVPLWFHVECFFVMDNDRPASVIGKMHDITQTRIAQMNLQKERLANVMSGGGRKSSLYDQMSKLAGTFSEEDYDKLAKGREFLGQLMEETKYTVDLSEGIKESIAKIGAYFQMDRIYVAEIDASAGTGYLDYQWNRKPDSQIRDFFKQVGADEIRESVRSYERDGYIEINPEPKIMPVGEDGEISLQSAIVRSVLGNQIWIPMVANGKTYGAICFDRYDTSPYSMVEKYLLSELVNAVSVQILKLNADNDNKAKSEFLSTMAHEIRTPMNAIVGMTEVTLREQLEDSVKKNLKMVKSSAFGLLTLINDILDYSKIEAGKFEIVKEPFALLPVLNDVKEITRARNDEKLDLIFYVPEDLPTKLRADSVRIKQVMINFCTNAIKYTDQGSVEIRVLMEKTGNNSANLTFRVKDSGIGIRKEDLPKLFKTYSRVDVEKNHHKEGNGLGLAISKQLVDLMDGTIGVESEYGAGSTFFFTIPVEVMDWKPAGSLDDYKYDDEDAAANEFAKLTAPDARVLIVDDTQLNLLVATALMEPVMMQITTAKSGVEAIKKIEENDFDLVFMDRLMPGMDGVETTKRIRALSDAKKSRVPIVALTADAMEGVKEELIGQGMNDFLTKPIIVKDLFEILKTWLPGELIHNE